MISCIEWVPKGVADPSPKKYEMSRAEIELLERHAEMEAELQQENHDDDDDEAENEPEHVKESISSKLPKIDPNSLPADLRMDEYSDTEDDNIAARGAALGNLLVGKESIVLGTSLDEEGMPVDEDDDDEEEEEGDGQTVGAVRDCNEETDYGDDIDSDDDLRDVPDTREYVPVDVEGLEAMGISNIGSGPVYLDQLDDEEDDDQGSDVDDVNLTPDDAVIVVAKTEDDFASLEVHVYEEKTGNLFVHHDIPLPSFPLCLAHGDINNEGGAGNYCAVGTFSPGIEVWNLDVLNALEPVCILGGEDSSAADQLMKANMGRAGRKPKKQRLPSRMVEGSHSDAVMSLSWNKIHRQVIASGSADKTVKLWDIADQGKNATTMTHHRDKVQAVVWHPSEGTLLATGSYDRTVAVVDARSAAENRKQVKISADCESLAWDPHNPQCLTAATEDGVLTCWDVRKFDTKTPVWSFVAEEYGGVSDLSYNPLVPGMLATCATNKTVTLWDTFRNGEPSTAAPQPCGNKGMNVGKLYTVSFYPSSPWLIGSGGSGNELALWDMTREAAVQARFGDRIANHKTPPPKPEDFEAMMAATDEAMEKARENAEKKKNKKKKRGKKKVPHKRSR